MRNIISLKKNSAIFLATLLIIGTIATIVPSIQAEPYYGTNKDRKQQVSVSSLKCNNLNVNVNGLELDVFPPFLSSDEGLAAEAQDANTDANSFESNEGSNSGSEINDFRFVCINNNNNTVIEIDEEEPPILSVDECTDCFLSDTAGGILPQSLIDSLNQYLSTNPVTVASASPEIVNNIAGLCDAIEDETGIAFAQITDILSSGFPAGSESIIQDIIDCLVDLDLILDPPV